MLVPSLVVKTLLVMWCSLSVGERCCGGKLADFARRGKARAESARPEPVRNRRLACEATAREAPVGIEFNGISPVWITGSITAEVRSGLHAPFVSGDTKGRIAHAGESVT